MSEDSLVTVLVAMIGAIAVVTAAAAPLLISTHRRAREAARDAALTRYEVTNDHDINLRIESDERHDEIMRQLTSHGQILKRNTGRIDKIMQRLEIVEETLPKRSR